MFTLSETIKNTLEALRSGNLELAKATFDQPTAATTGLQLWNLDAAVKTLVPRYTPLRNSIPRVGGQFAIQANWKAVTAIDGSNTPVGVPEGTRNAAIAATVTDYNAVFKTLSVEASASFQAQWAGRGLEDVQARARKTGAHKYIVGEELVILGGNTTSTGIALGTPATPASTIATTGGSISQASQYAYVVALTLDGYKVSSLANGAGTTTSVTPADGSSAFTVKRGSSQKSAEGSALSMTGSTNKVTWTVTDIPGAVAYVWYLGSATGAANAYIAAITTVNKYVRTTNVPTTGQKADAITADNSQDQYVFDGLITQIAKSTSSAYYKTLEGTTLTADNKGGITEFDELLVDRFVNYKVSTYEILMSAKQTEKAGKAIRTGAAATPFTIDVSDGKNSILGGSRAIGYVHPITGETLPFVVHPDLPDGTIIFKLVEAGPLYEDDRIPNVWQMAMRQEPFSIEWPLKTLKYEIAVVADGVLQGYFPAGNGMLSNVALS